MYCPELKARLELSLLPLPPHFSLALSAEVLCLEPDEVNCFVCLLVSKANRGQMRRKSVAPLCLSTLLI